MDLRHASFFSGIGAFDLGLERAGFRVVSHSEVKPFANAVLESRWPGVPNLGDLNALCPDGEGEHDCPIPAADVWTGGFPCSDFSIMGKRKGLLTGTRSTLGLVFLDLVRRHRPPYVILENVPGLLSSHEGRDLALLLSTLGDIGYGWSFRLLDARNFGLPQARRRVFVVAAADPADAAAVLDDNTYRSMDAEEIRGPRRATLAGRGGGAPQRSEVVIGPTYTHGQSRSQLRDGDTFPITPSNYQYVLEPVVIERHGHFAPQQRRDGAAYTLLPVGAGGNIGEQYVIDEEPIVIKRHGALPRDGYQSVADLRRDGAAYALMPNAGRDDQYIIRPDRGPGPVVVYPTFSKRDQQRLASRDDGASYTILPSAIPFILEDEWDDLPGGDGGLLGDGRRGGDGAGARAGERSDAPAGHAGSAPAGSPADAGQAPDADRVRAAAGLPGRLDDPDGGDAGEVGPQHLDTARWHVLGRACPVPIVTWMGLALRTVIEAKQGDER